MTQDTECRPKQSSHDDSKNGKKGPASSSSCSTIALLVQQEEMKEAQKNKEHCEDYELSHDSTNNESEPDQSNILLGNTNSIMEIDDNDDVRELDKGNPYISTTENGRNIPDKNLPCDRWGHTMTLIEDDRLLVYGGQTFDKNENKITTLADLHVYDMTKKIWSRPVNCEGMPRCWVSS
jgi:hypothetical protein